MITPIDIQQVGFGIRFRGYDRKEVDQFLDELSRDYEALIRENQELRDRQAHLEAQVSELKKKEGTLNRTLVSVQQIVEEIKHNAQKDAELLLKEAQLKAQEITKGAYDEKARLHSEIADLQRQRVIFLEKIRSMLRAFEKTAEMEEKLDPMVGGEGENNLKARFR